VLIRLTPGLRRARAQPETAVIRSTLRRAAPVLVRKSGYSGYAFRLAAAYRPPHPDHFGRAAVSLSSCARGRGYITAIHYTE
jgi:hypothetical protein